MKIGFVGLGQMGWPMFKNLASKVGARKIIGFDCSSSRMSELRDTHESAGTLASSINELFDVDVLITMLPHGKAVQSVILGEGGTGLIANLKEAAIVIDMSSSSPADTKFLYKALKSKHIRLCDAPVSGSVAKAKASTLSIMLGCDNDLAEQVKPILMNMGTEIISTGGVGTAHAMKSLNNYLYAAGLLAASEALLMGEALGLDLEKLVDVFNSSSGRNVATETKIKQHMLAGGDFKAGFGLRLMAKDLSITHGLKDSLGFLPPQLDLCFRTWQDAIQKLPEQADNTEIMRYLKKELTPTPSRESV
ncbi:NAD(P)-dependent oxidoreductase [Alcaligenaceae bacterium]|nr:NAD(P)-dependent oxidoreductase [Alcaligenaceae bacterium]